MEIKTLSWGKVVNVDGSRFLGRNIFNLHYFFFFGFRKEQFHCKIGKKRKKH